MFKIFGRAVSMMSGRNLVVILLTIEVEYIVATHEYKVFVWF